MNTPHLKHEFPFCRAQGEPSTMPTSDQTKIVKVLTSHAREHNPVAVIFNPLTTRPTTAKHLKIHYERCNVGRSLPVTRATTKTRFLLPDEHREAIPVVENKFRPKSNKKPRPKSAVVFKTKECDHVEPETKHRPPSASTVSTQTSDASGSVQELTKTVGKVTFKRRTMRRVWRPKKSENGITYTAPPLPSNKPDTEQTQSETTDSKPKPNHNGLAQFPRYKYPQYLHCWGKSHVQMSLDVPDCLRKGKRYSFLPHKQGCEYSPFKSVTHLNHRHKVRSTNLPHQTNQGGAKPRSARSSSPLAGFTQMTLDQRQFTLADLNANDDVNAEDDGAGSWNNHGSYAFTHQERTSDNNVESFGGGGNSRDSTPRGHSSRSSSSRSADSNTSEEPHSDVSDSDRRPRTPRRSSPSDDINNVDRVSNYSDALTSKRGLVRDSNENNNKNGLSSTAQLSATIGSDNDLGNLEKYEAYVAAQVEKEDSIDKCDTAKFVEEAHGSYSVAACEDEEDYKYKAQVVVDEASDDEILSDIEDEVDKMRQNKSLHNGRPPSAARFRAVSPANVVSD